MRFQTWICSIAKLFRVTSSTCNSQGNGGNSPAPPGAVVTTTTSLPLTEAAVTTTSASVSVPVISTTASSPAQTSVGNGGPVVITSVSVEDDIVIPSSVVISFASTTSSVEPIPEPSNPASPVSDGSVEGTVLILARDQASADRSSSGLQGYGIPFESVIVPQEGIDLPQLNTSARAGKYSAIIAMESLSYDYGESGFQSALTEDQWTALYNYQTSFGVRMVRINEWPGSQFGVTPVSGGCCGAGVEQLVSFSDTEDFPTANVKTNAGMSTVGIWHVPARVTDEGTTKMVAKFEEGGGFEDGHAAAVINNFQGREQFVWFMAWATEWSVTSNYLQHAHIHWMTRGLFLGKRKTHLGAQIDDLQLESPQWDVPDGTFKLRPSDMDGHIPWQSDLNSRLPEGSDFWLELAHNGNGAIIGATSPDGSDGVCDPDTAIYYDEQPATELEFKKPLGTGEDQWPSEFQTYEWQQQCPARDELAAWFLESPSNLNAFGHLSHTFTHLSLNNATYEDAAREIQFNRDWLTQMGIDQAERYSPQGLVPPAITGLNNGDVIRAWLDNNITYVVGDNSRTPLKSTESVFWPLISTEAQNGHDGLVIVPRHATTIFFNCDTIECNTAQWNSNPVNQGDFNDLLENAKIVNTRHLLALQSDPFMFHQANMRFSDMPTITVGTKTAKMSLVMAWVEVVAQEIARLTDWPIVTITHDQIAEYFVDRMEVDRCQPALSYGLSASGTTIESVTVTTANGNSCSRPIPVTIPGGSVTASGGSVTEDKVGNEPPIQWVTMNGSPVTLTLSDPVAGARGNGTLN